MKRFLESKTNVIGVALLTISVFLVIILKGSFSDWALFSTGVFWAITGRNINRANIQAKAEKATIVNI